MSHLHSLSRPFLFLGACAALAWGCDRNDEETSRSDASPPAQTKPSSDASPKVKGKPKADRAADTPKTDDDGVQPKAIVGPKPEAPRLKEAAPVELLGKSTKGLGLKTGAAGPDVSATNLQGQKVSLKTLAEVSPVLLVFYRGGWCPYCNFQVRQLSQAADDFEARGITPVLVSVDRGRKAAKTIATYEIPFPVLSDPDLEMHEAFRVLNRVGAEKVESLKKHGMDLEEWSGRTHHTLAHPSVFVLDDGVVKFSHVDEDYRRRPSIEQLEQMLDELGYESGSAR